MPPNVTPHLFRQRPSIEAKCRPFFPATRSLVWLRGLFPPAWNNEISLINSANLPRSAGSHTAKGRGPFILRQRPLQVIADSCHYLAVRSVEFFAIWWAFWFSVTLVSAGKLSKAANGRLRMNFPLFGDCSSPPGLRLPKTPKTWFCSPGLVFSGLFSFFASWEAFGSFVPLQPFL